MRIPLLLFLVLFPIPGRYLYSNKLGFLGGVSWALLCARVCQQYPNAPPSKLVCMFFIVWDAWDWATPVSVNKIRKSGNNMNGVMPIITPSYPQQNSTHNVTQSTLYQMKEEFRISRAITVDIDKNIASWDTLFEKRSFFTEYRLYVRIQLTAVSTEIMWTWYFIYLFILFFFGSFFPAFLLLTHFLLFHSLGNLLLNLEFGN